MTKLSKLAKKTKEHECNFCGEAATEKDWEGVWYCKKDWWWCAGCGEGFGTDDLGKVPDAVITSQKEHDEAIVYCTECAAEEPEEKQKKEVIPCNSFKEFLKSPEAFNAVRIKDDDDNDWTEDSKLEWVFCFPDDPEAHVSLSGWWENGDLYIHGFVAIEPDCGHGQRVLRFLRQYSVFQSIETYGGETDEGKGFFSLMEDRGLIGTNLKPMDIEKCAKCETKDLGEKPEKYILKGEQLCQECYEETEVLCPHCKENTLGKDAAFVNDDSKWEKVCVNCWFTCDGDDCSNNVHSIDEMVDPGVEDGSLFCKGCWDHMKKTITCPHCKERKLDEGSARVGHQEVCSKCYGICNGGCGEPFLIKSLVAADDEGDLYCSRCWEKKEAEDSQNPKKRKELEVPEKAVQVPAKVVRLPAKKYIFCYKCGIPISQDDFLYCFGYCGNCFPEHYDPVQQCCSSDLNIPAKSCYWALDNDTILTYCSPEKPCVVVDDDGKTDICYRPPDACVAEEFVNKFYWSEEEEEEESCKKQKKE